MSEPPTGLVATTTEVLRHAAKSRPQRWLVAITLLLGVLGAVAVIAGAPPAERTFVALSKTVQSLMSAVLPFTGVLLAREALRSPKAPMWLAATIVAVATGLFGVVVSAAAGGWDDVALSVAVASVLVQVVAQLVGTGFGLLLRPAIVACLATIVLPLGLWLLLRGTPVQAWVTPYATVQNLFSGHATITTWMQWSVVFLLWGVGLNAVATRR